MEHITIGKTVSIRSKGFNEFWLQDRICENPSVLNLGDLELLAKEKPQSGAGRLDILLKEPTENSMYEVEVMLGETDESHIIRTIEYWDREKRKFPKRSHTAVLVAETINARYFNIIHLFSHAIPIIAIQVELIETANEPILHFSTILNTYEEPEDTEDAPQEEYNENQWQQIAPSTLEMAKALVELLRPVFPDVNLHYVQSYIAITINGRGMIKLRKRGTGKTQFGFWISPNNFKATTDLLSASNILPTQKENMFYFFADINAIKKNPEVTVNLVKLVKDSWEN